MPKLLPPPLSAAQRSECELREAVTKVPFARTSSAATRLSAAQPYCVVRKLKPPAQSDSANVQQHVVWTVSDYGSLRGGILHTAEHIPAHTHVPDPPTDDSNTQWVQCLLNILPAIARPDTDAVRGGIVRNLSKATHGDQGPASNAGEIKVWAVPAALNGKLVIVGMERRQDG
jgi:hypothetical protein